MKSQHQNPEFRNTPENFHQCCTLKSFVYLNLWYTCKILYIMNVIQMSKLMRFRYRLHIPEVKA